MSLSGKFVLRIDPKLHESFRKEAQAAGLSLNQFLVNKLATNSEFSAVVNPMIKQFGDSLIGIVLFGSVVRGEEHKSSDIDLILVLENEVAISRELYSLWDKNIAPTIGDRFSPQFVHAPESLDQLSSLWLEASLEGQVLFDSGNFLKRLVSSIKQKIAAGDYVRRISHGHPYWTKVDQLKQF